jgi:type III secretory pathway component EscV
MNMKTTLILIGTFALSLVMAYPMMSLAQEEEETGNQTESQEQETGNQTESQEQQTGSQSTSQSQVEVPMNFTLKAKGGEKAKEGQENKSITVDVTIQQGEGGSPTKVPVTAMVPNNTKMQDVQLCSSMKEGKQSCQSLKDFMPKENQSSSGSSEESKSSSNTNDNGGQ